MSGYVNELIAYDPIVARNFYLDIPNLDKFVLSGVSGLEVELDVVSVAQNGAGAIQQHIKTLGGQLKSNDITITRMAPLKAQEDKLWKWFLDIRKLGMVGGRASAFRRDGSIVLYDGAFTEVGRFNFFKGWPSKIATDAMTTDSNEPMKETITMVVERIERVH
ncbi:phage tail protein [Jatrophihabitans fulvus]